MYMYMYVLSIIHWFSFHSTTFHVFIFDRRMGKRQSAKAKTKAQISFALTATQIVHFLFFLNPKLYCLFVHICSEANV